MQTSEFNAMNRAWENQELDRYLNSLDRYEAEEEMEEESEPACLNCRRKRCFECGYGFNSGE